MKKDFYKSKTVWGLALAILGYILGVQEIVVAGLGLTGYGFRDAMK